MLELKNIDNNKKTFRRTSQHTYEYVLLPQKHFLKQKQKIKQKFG